MVVSRVTLHVDAIPLHAETVTGCDTCGDSLADYFPGCNRCDNCTDLHGLEFEPVQVDSLPDVLRDIGLTGSGLDSLGFWK